jgi:hypothetical protein
VGRKNHWNLEARNLLRAELVRRGVTYKQLARLLPAVGRYETEDFITSKMARGKFQLAFFLQCMWAIGSKTLHIQVSGPDSEPAGRAADKANAEKLAAHSKRVRKAASEALDAAVNEMKRS